MLPEERARVKIDKQLSEAGWDIVMRNEYVPKSAAAVKEALMQGNTESDYLLFVDDKAIAVVEAKREENPLADDVENQAEGYSAHPQGWYGLWFNNRIPLVYLANGNKIYFKNMLTDPDGDYIELPVMHTPKKMLQIIGKKSEYGALPKLVKNGLRDCQYNAEVSLEVSLKSGKKKALSILATGSGKTYLACLAAYRLLNYTPTKRVLFLVDRNNLARQTESEFSLFDRTEDGKALSDLYRINRLKKVDDIKGDVIISTIQKLFAVLTGQDIPDERDEDREDEFSQRDNEKALKETVSLDGKMLLPPDYFQFIVIDECHRSIYGRWRAVLDYFKDAKILGLTATPTPEAYAFFDNNIVEKYTYNESVIDGVNVPARVYRISTNVTVHGGTINAGDTITEKSKKTGVKVERTATERLDFSPTQLDRSITNPKQIETVLAAYRDAICLADALLTDISCKGLLPLFDKVIGFNICQQIPYEDIIPKRSQHMKFGCSRTVSVGQILKNGRFSVFKAGCNLGDTNIPLGKVSKTVFYLFPMAHLSSVFAAISIIYQRHRNKRYIQIIIQLISRINNKYIFEADPAPRIRNIKGKVVVDIYRRLTII
ncbi:MAG: DEAD/DEAH box helicase family protein [Oscillospiraceae bacterium]